ncbi:hypothetical protein Franean1_1202 [Parafrankia sp. EAN1pec]|uniref:hypothetical protein n=1 Tax=Parafrankia sp. (strain EAN1pec) TaxID=298653 RepID=UPI0000544B71|nr:hypothetical protein Franean1_1202 [Frankia sp. EAN1pec]
MSTERPDPRSHQSGAEPPGPETAYRRLLLCYPRRWREARGEELLGTLLDGAEAAGRTRPSRAEVVDLVVHGLATRCALAAAVAGRRRIMRVALVVTYPATGTVLALGRHTDLLRPPLSLLLVLAVLAVPALAGAAVTRAPGRRGAGPRGLVAATGAVLGWVALLGVFGYRFGWWSTHDDGFLGTLRLSSTGYWSGSFYGSLAETVPQGLLAGGLLGAIVGVRRPGWVAAVFVCGVVLCVLPVLHAWVDHWVFHQRIIQIALALAVLLSVALVDAWRARRILSTKGPAGPAGVPPTLI